jgi:DNA-binding CsgD family transcriptional regulator
MSDGDLILQTIDAIYASGIEINAVSDALDALNRLLGGAGATFEIVDMASSQHRGFWSVGAPSQVSTRYVNEFAAINPHIPFASSQPKGHIIWDYQHVDEDQMARHPFYADFLPTVGLRYCTGAVLERTEDKLVVVYAQRTSEQGHVDQREIDLMQRLCPHFQRAYDMASRLNIAGNHRGALENALDWLTDGIALLRADGSIVYANDALCTFARRCDGFRIVDGIIEFIESEVHGRFAAAFSAICQVHADSFNMHPTDFPVSRCNGMPAYTVAIRPLVPGQRHLSQYADVVVMLFIHDPLARNVAANHMLQALFGLTNAEANLAQALSAGMTTGTYATTRRLSLNTVYTHLRRIREKTSCNSVAELVRKFGELNVPLRLKQSPIVTDTRRPNLSAIDAVNSI